MAQRHQPSSCLGGQRVHHAAGDLQGERVGRDRCRAKVASKPAAVQRLQAEGRSAQRFLCAKRAMQCQRGGVHSLRAARCSARETHSPLWAAAPHHTQQHLLTTMGSSPPPHAAAPPHHYGQHLLCQAQLLRDGHRAAHQLQRTAAGKMLCEQRLLPVHAWLPDTTNQQPRVGWPCLGQQDRCAVCIIIDQAAAAGCARQLKQQKRDCRPPRLLNCSGSVPASALPGRSGR